MSDEDIKLSRRKILAGLGTIGVASAGAGLGTTAWLSDDESFLNNTFTAGTLDLTVRYWSHVDQDGSGPSHGGHGGANNGGDVSNGGEPISIDVADVKPGDWGSIKFCFDLVDNPAYLWACGTLTDSAENGYAEPEPVDENGEGELDDAIDATAYYCPEADHSAVDDPADIPADSVIASGSLGDVVQGLTYGVPLDGDGDTSNGVRAPFEAGVENHDNPCVCIYWEVPTTVGNRIQGDSISFDVVFNAVQSRHNDGSANPCCDCADDQVALCVDNEVYCLTPFSGADVTDWYDYVPADYASQNPLIQESNTATLGVFRDDDGELYLVIVNDSTDDESGGGEVTYTISGLSGGQSWVVQDDHPSGNDSYSVSGSTATGSWDWNEGKTDGGVLGALGDTFDVTVDMDFDFGIDAVRVIEPDDGGATAVWSDDDVGATASVQLRDQCVTVPGADAPALE